ncbi:Protein CBG13341 [Caenorhabditis briggsae]|uniref:Protein CBG13341 n=1 Tax=Caenorhabditis briggsae TaxID=6238 RepID=A8XI02_CAEBR|nr:Protein CBG13341 [Caenorhabditis briggsae]CAP32268.2 Protein CBG13341 [Caenorhabditis briggsae]
MILRTTKNEIIEISESGPKSDTSLHSMFQSISAFTTLQKDEEIDQIVPNAKIQNFTSIVYDSCEPDQPLVYIAYRPFAIMKFSEHKENENVKFQLSISGKIIDFG